MFRKHLGSVGLGLLVLLAFPNSGDAAIWDWNWSMSGPQMHGVVFHCEYDPQHKANPTPNVATGRPPDAIECRIVDLLVKPLGTLTRRADRKSRLFLSLDTGVFFSSAYDAEDITDFKWFENYMVAFEPMLEIRGKSFLDGDFVLHHGLMGVSYDVLFGDGYKPFDKVGFKFRPVGVTIRKKFNASFTLRFYPNGFTADEFGQSQPRLNDINRDGEWVFGGSFGYIWKP